MPDKVDKDKTWQCLSKSDLKIGTKALLCAAQEQVIRTNYIKHYIDKTSENLLCKLCRKKVESVRRLVIGYENLAQREYKRRYDNVAKKTYWDLCKKNEREHTEKWYEHVPEGTVENEEVKVLWDINVQCDNVIEARRPDIILTDKKERKCTIIDIAVPADVRVGEKETKKMEKYYGLKRDWKILETKNGRYLFILFTYEYLYRIKMSVIFTNICTIKLLFSFVLY